MKTIKTQVNVISISDVVVFLRKYFSEEAADAYIRNVVNRSLERNMNTLDNITAMPVKDAFMSAFYWRGTPEGHEYWSNINKAWALFVEAQKITDWA